MLLLTVGEAVTRPRLSPAALAWVEQILSLPDSSQSSTALNTLENYWLYGLVVTLDPLRQSVALRTNLLSGKLDLISSNLPLEENKAIEGFLQKEKTH